MMEIINFISSLSNVELGFLIVGLLALALLLYRWRQVRKDKNLTGRRYCTLPAIFGLRVWFESKFKDLCQLHDQMYLERVWKRKVIADEIFIHQMQKRGYRLLSYVCWFFFITVGTGIWCIGKIMGR